MLQERKGDQNMVEGSELSDRRLAHLEAVIQKYRQDFYAVGKALNEIRDGRHYQKLCFTTFERYVNVRWDMSKSQAYRLIEAFAVIDNLSPRFIFFNVSGYLVVCMDLIPGFDFSIHRNCTCCWESYLGWTLNFINRSFTLMNELRKFLVFCHAGATHELKLEYPRDQEWYP